jgi:hypothetical protein
MAKQLVQTEPRFEETKDDQWEDRTGASPRRWCMWTGTSIKITPIPTDYASNSVRIDYIEQPTALANDADTVDSRIPLNQQEYLKYAAAAWLLQMMNDEQNIALASAFDKQFNNLIKGVR